ncbi:acyl-CoA dehydrogenase [Natrialba magadii ATCC 43099]|uniref:Acyl-CoA dehydrogenase n=1 Tax=Natrialba magadii (strain ATCC 43099 / DSM 3394 / CCM 3739 / CIP 104546 / IAM 13178 / JCM 8861 / NBRC 102185 / NCIMB 2190 / MS3) TaxID=547559 RepID=D3ST98_NATMM|nr:acyl-CoA dehydrogenase family protein [Natrialba magadii]ADD06965.1 acyl-CoA dehydrogenase [Natrialba magadii ATCC 43099]ELY28892.1 acyl-CoA dehydrogenase domain-containing protein [Natrialba magadii ATCC 43099]
MDFSEPSEAVQITKALEDFIEQEVAPLEQEYEQFLGQDYEKHIVDENHRQVPAYREVVETIRKKSVEAGFYGMTMPEEVGGGDVDILTRAIVGEHMANRPPGFHSAIFGGAGGPTPILLACDEEQRERYLQPLMDGEITTCFALTEPGHGSDAHHMDTVAEKSESHSDSERSGTAAENDGDEWVINGQKVYITNGPYADFAMVFARTSGEDGDLHGITCFLVEADNPGFEVGTIHRSMGMTPGQHAELHFDDCRVGEDQILGEVDQGFTAAMSWIGGGRINIAANSVGTAQYLLDMSVEYARDRETFDKPIGHRQGVSFQLADLATDIEQTRQLYRYAAWKMDNGDRARKEESMAKLRGAELANKAADIAMQVHGGAGYMKELPIERNYRSARVFRIFEGTDEIQKRTIARELI